MASRQAIAAVQRQIFGTLPNKNIRTGNQILKKRLKGEFVARYYLDPIEPYARIVRCPSIHFLISYPILSYPMIELNEF